MKVGGSGRGDGRSLADALKQAREHLDLTQEQWAVRLGVSVRTVSRWEQGMSIPRGSAQKAVITANSLEEDVPTLRSVMGMKTPTTGATDKPIPSVTTSKKDWTFGQANSPLHNSLPTINTSPEPFHSQQTFNQLLPWINAAQELGVEWDSFRKMLISVLTNAQHQGLYLTDLLQLFKLPYPNTSQ